MRGLVLAIVLCVTGQVVAQEANKWTMELRVAASATEDTAIVESAKNSDAQEVFTEGRVVAKWVPTLESTGAILKENSEFVTRASKERIELLVLVSPNDVTESDVHRLYSDKDMRGRMALRVVFSDKGSSKIFTLTKNLIGYKKPERYMAEIMDGRVYATPVILAPVSGSVLIMGDISQPLIDDIGSRAKLGPVFGVLDKSEIPPYAIVVTPLRIVLFFGILVIVALGSFSAKGLQESKHPQIWVVIGIVVGAFIGAYVLGFSVTYGTADVGGGVSAITKTTHISILWILVGGVIGAGLGFLAGRLCRFFIRRAIHNVGRLVYRGFQPDDPAKTLD